MAAALPQVSLGGSEAAGYNWFFSRLNGDASGSVSVTHCASLFRSANIDESKITHILHAVDVRKDGKLDKNAFFIALRLISQAQQGQAFDMSAVVSAAEMRPAVIAGMDPSSSAPMSPRTPMSPMAASSSSFSFPQLTRGQIEVFLLQFQELSPQGGRVDGARMRDFMQKTGLARPILAQIWTASDADADGAMTAAEFIVAMTLIQLAQRSAALPDVVPPAAWSLVQQMIASVQASAPTSAAGTPRLVAQSSSPYLAPMQAMNVQAAPMQAESAWAVTPAEQQKFYAIYDSVDTQRKGFLTGAEVQKLMSSTNLPNNILSHIWNLCDLRKAGVLTRDELAVGLKLVYLALDGTALPPTLPPNWIPPSMRSSSATSAAPSAAPSAPEDPAVAEARAPLLALRKETDELRAKMSTLQSEIYELSLRRTTLENDHVAATRERTELEGIVSNGERELETSRPAVAELEAAVAAQREEMERLTREHAEMEAQARTVEQHKGAVQQLMAHRAGELEENRQQHRKIESLVLMGRSEAERLKAERGRLEAELETLKAKATQFDEQDSFADFDSSFGKTATA